MQPKTKLREQKSCNKKKSKENFIFTKNQN